MGSTEMNTIAHFAISVLVLLVFGCKERVVLPACPLDAPVAIAEVNGVRYRAQLQDALRCSRETGRPILLTFHGWASSSTSAAWDVLANPDVKALIEDRLVLCVLLVDERDTLSPEDLFGFPQLKGNPTTIGQRNSMLEREFFSKVSQPLFTLVNADFVSLAEPQGYIPKKDPELLIDWIVTTLEQHP